jgi:hypothetical protein
MKTFFTLLNRKIPSSLAIIIVSGFALLMGVLVYNYYLALKQEKAYKIIYIKPSKLIQQKEVVIFTDKKEYALGEKVKIILRNNLDKPIYYVDYLCPPWWNLEFEIEEKWKIIEEFSPETLKYCREGEKFCRKGYITEYNYCPPQKPIQNLVKKLEPNSEVLKIWTLKNRKYLNGYLVEDIRPGNYRLSLSYGFSQEAYDKNLIYSNEFKVKKDFWRRISDICKESREIMEKIRSNPECLKGKEFICIDGWGATWYYDKRLTEGLTDFPKTWPSNTSEKLKEATIAIAKMHQSICSCKNPISYKILVKNEFKEATCEEFYQFLRNYETSCGNCIERWSFGCC